jgi:hypothetical protein
MTTVPPRELGFDGRYYRVIKINNKDWAIYEAVGGGLVPKANEFLVVALYRGKMPLNLSEDNTYASQGQEILLRLNHGSRKGPGLVEGNRFRKKEL